MSSARKRPAFTLVELLVVIGIIAVLIGILLPTLARAREHGRQVACMSNIRQVALAIVMYANENKGWLPADSRNSPYYAHDFLHWEANRDLDQSAIAKYLARINDLGGLNSDTTILRSFPVNVMRCPSDDVTYRIRGGTTNAAYRYSYVMNQYINSGATLSGQDSNFIVGFLKKWAVGKLTQVHHHSEKVLLFEEEITTIDDGHGTPDLGKFTNLLAIRHDIQKNLENDVLASYDSTNLPNRSKRGNVGFCDGSARYISREQFHNKSTYLPRYPEIQ